MNQIQLIQTLFFTSYLCKMNLGHRGFVDGLWYIPFFNLGYCLISHFFLIHVLYGLASVPLLPCISSYISLRGFPVRMPSLLPAICARLWVFSWLSPGKEVHVTLDARWRGSQRHDVKMRGGVKAWANNRTISLSLHVPWWDLTKKKAQRSILHIPHKNTFEAHGSNVREAWPLSAWTWSAGEALRKTAAQDERWRGWLVNTARCDDVVIEDPVERFGSLILDCIFRDL